ncbi:MAG: adenosine kinase [Nitrospinales bacterium]
MNYEMVGIGNALVDIQVKVDDEFIKKLGVAKGGMTLAESDYQSRVLENLSDHSQKISSGGSAANTIHGVGVLGGSVYYLGRVANDVYGRHYSEDMKACGVGFPGPGAETNGTGVSVVLITPDSQRTMITHLGISAALHADNVDETIVHAAKMVYIEGYLWTGDETRAAALKMAEIAKKEDIPVAFTLSDVFVANQFKDELVDFIRWHVDILFCNETEALALTDAADAADASVALQGMADTMFLTLGGKGALAGQVDGNPIAVKAFAARAVDTTGAGDLFAAGALYGLLRKHDLEESAIIGSYCAGQVVSHLGARMPVHAHTSVPKILKQYRELDD